MGTQRPDLVGGQGQRPVGQGIGNPGKLVGAGSPDPGCITPHPGPWHRDSPGPGVWLAGGSGVINTL